MILQMISHLIIVSSLLLKILTLLSGCVKRFISIGTIYFNSTFLHSFRIRIANLLYKVFSIITLLALSSLRISSTTNYRAMIKSVGARSLSCLTLHLYQIIISSLTNFNATLKSLCNFSTHFIYQGGASIFINNVDIISY